VAKRYTMGEVARIAEEVERNGYAFYSRFAESARDPQLRELCRELAHAEGEHQATFAAIFTNEPDEEAEAFPGDGEALIRSIVREYVFTQADEKEFEALSLASTDEFIDFAIGKERAAIELFEGIRAQLSRRASRLVGEIIEQERDHVRMLKSVRSM